ncbi:MAG: hypothetical protein R3Y50_09815 [Rikenellaceae bacterium]
MQRLIPKQMAYLKAAAKSQIMTPQQLTAMINKTIQQNEEQAM